MYFLNSGRINLSQIRDYARTELFNLLDAIDGSKSMVWDSSLVGPFGLISDYKLLKEHKVNQMLELRSGTLPTINTKNIVYFLRPNLASMNIIAGNHCLAGTFPKLIHLFLFFLYRKH